MPTYHYYDQYHRLEPARPGDDLDRGFAGEIADPVWFLGRQWQLGELQGEDAASPVLVHYRALHQPVDPHAGNPRMDPRRVPPEAIVESEPQDWWAPGRRVQVGYAVASTTTLLPPVDQADPDLLLRDLPVPYDRLNGRGYDGFALYTKRAELGLEGLHPDPFAAVPAEPPQDLWDPAELVYTTEFTCAGQTLRLPRHSGGRLDWYSVDAAGALSEPEAPPDEVWVYPTRLRYPGAPLPRWWQIEDSRVDIGGFPPDRSHFATLLLIEVIAAHSNDWFLIPIDTRAGHLVTLRDVWVRDIFGDDWPMAAPTDWSLFRLTGLDAGPDVTSLLVWATVATPLEGPVLEEVHLGVDEDANVLWAVERRLRGRDVATLGPREGDLPTPPSPQLEPQPETPPLAQATAPRKRYKYQASTPMDPYWHPYLIPQVNGPRRDFVQGQLANLNARPPRPLAPPSAHLLEGVQQGELPEQTPPQQIEPATIPSRGLRLERRYMLGRDTRGQPVLWMQRRREPLLSPPAMRLRFDMLEARQTLQSDHG